jgi:hypothetical protein
MPPLAKARNLVGDPLEAVFLACGLAGPVRKFGGKTGVIATCGISGRASATSRRAPVAATIAPRRLIVQCTVNICPSRCERPYSLR